MSIRSCRAKSAALSKANEASGEPRRKTAGEWPRTAQSRWAVRRMSSAPKPPIEIPPIAIRCGSAPERRSAAGIAHELALEREVGDLRLRPELLLGGAAGGGTEYDGKSGERER